MSANLFSRALRSHSWLAVGLLAIGLLATMGTLQPSHAQVVNTDERANPLGDLENSSETNVFGTRDGDLNPFDIIHNSNFRGPSPEDFFRETQENLNTQTSEFLKKRQQLLKQQQNQGTIQFGEGVLPASEAQ